MSYLHLIQLAAGEEGDPGHLEAHHAGQKSQLGEDDGLDLGIRGAQTSTLLRAHPWTVLGATPPTVDTRGWWIRTQDSEQTPQTPVSQFTPVLMRFNNDLLPN